MYMCVGGMYFTKSDHVCVLGVCISPRAIMYMCVEVMYFTKSDHVHVCWGYVFH
jgi:hypothetical protein